MAARGICEAGREGGSAPYRVADAVEIGAHLLDGGGVGLDTGLAPSLYHLIGRLQRIQRINRILPSECQDLVGVSCAHMQVKRSG